MKWIDILPIPAIGAKTKRFRVQSGSAQLGEIRFYSRWRKYAFFPYEGTLYEEDCLRDIAAFCELVTKEWRLEVSQRRRRGADSSTTPPSPARPE